MPIPRPAGTAHGLFRPTEPQPTSVASRRGSVLLVVLVVVMLLSLGAYTFSEIMVSELRATDAYGRAARCRTFADSGVEYVAALLLDRESLDAGALYHNPELFQGVLIQQSDNARGQGRFSIVASVESDPAARTVRFGLMNESSKLNLNALPKLIEDAELDEEQSRNMLLGLPGMTEETADAILDWIDEDDDLRQFGAESEVYQSLAPPYEMKAQGVPLRSIDELMLVNGVTPYLLFGEDANRNGLLDPNENDGDLSPPGDNADGVLQLGWSSYLTVHSRESNRRSDGSDRINLNQSSLDTLFDELEEEFDEGVAQFVVAYLISGPLVDEAEELIKSAGGGSGSAGGGSGSMSSVSANGLSGAQQQALQQLATTMFAPSQGGSVTRAGIDLLKGKQATIKSIYDLIDAQVSVEVDGKVQTLDSPWTSDPSDMQHYLPELMDKLTTTDAEFIQGRVDVNQARFEVLQGLPGMTEQLADAIAKSTMIGSGGEPLLDAMQLRSTTGWLLIEGLAELEQLRELDRYITTGGDVFRTQVVGYLDRPGTVTRLEAVIDRTGDVPKVVFLRDLSELGQGYSHSLLQLR